MPTIRNIVIFILVAALVGGGYYMFIKKPGPEGSLVTLPSTNSVTEPGTPATGALKVDNVVAQDFLALLLNVKNIKLDDSIFSDPAWDTLKDSSIELKLEEGQEGRPNPFAPLGVDPVPTPEVFPPAVSTEPATVAPAANPGGTSVNPTPPASTPPPVTAPNTTTPAAPTNPTTPTPPASAPTTGQ